MNEIGRLRSLLFAPAVRPDFIAKLPERGADAVVVDCEDATPAGAKDLARQHVRDLVPALAKKCKVTVRVNAVASEWFADDINDGVVSEVAAIVVPKIDSVDALKTVSTALEGMALATSGSSPESKLVLGLLMHDSSSLTSVSSLRISALKISSPIWVVSAQPLMKKCCMREVRSPLLLDSAVYRFSIKW